MAARKEGASVCYIQPRSKPAGILSADDLERTETKKGSERQKRHVKKSIYVICRQHSVINLKHVERQDQQKDIHDRGE